VADTQNGIIIEGLRKRYGSAYPFPRMEVPTPMVWAFGPLFDRSVTRDFIRKNVGYRIRFDNRRSRACCLASCLRYSSRSPRP